MTEKEKMIQGLPYNPVDPKLVWDRDRAMGICQKYNRSRYHEINMRPRLMRKLLRTEGNFLIKPPFYCDYGYNIHIGKEVMLNFGCVLLDVCPIKIGDHTLIGPNTHLYTACHSHNIEERRNNIEFGKPIVIENDVWIGGNVTILPGVHIGEGAIIGAGSVVVSDIPANVVAVGNPCRIVRKINQKKD